MIEDFERCYRAVESRDDRFDGWFFTAVTSTGIYCRPSCPAITPKRSNVRFYPTAAAAQSAGFRACRRCRPDAAPGSPEWNTRADVVARAMRLIADGLVDREGVPGLARRLGYSERQLQRQLVAEVGAGPLALARAQRAHTARVLIETTTLPLADVAFSSGFASVRQFNDTIRAVFARSPSQMRIRVAKSSRPLPGGAVHLRLAHRSPLHVDALFSDLAARAVPGVEEYYEGKYRRTLDLPFAAGIVAASPGGNGYLQCTLQLADPRDLTAAVHRTRRLLDLDADPVAVDAVLRGDAHLAPVVASRPGLRVPRSVDPDELAIRAVIGQQISMAAARTAAGRLVLRLGKPLTAPQGTLTHLFPSAEALAASDEADMPMPRARAKALTGLARALADGRVKLGPGADRLEAQACLLALPGIGPWTASYIAMRGLGDPDAFPTTDLGLVKAARQLGIADLPRTSSAWRPWRSYAAQYLWSTLEEPT